MVWLTPRPGMMVTLGRAGFSCCLGIDADLRGRGDAPRTRKSEDRGAPSSSQQQRRDAFDVERLRKKIDRLHARDAIAVRCEETHVACEGSRIARDVDDATAPERAERGDRVG